MANIPIVSIYFLNICDSLGVEVLTRGRSDVRDQHRSERSTSVITVHENHLF